MSNLVIKDGNGEQKYIKKSGTGTDVDPYVDASTIVSLDTNGQIDGFGRLRVSEVTTQIDIKQIHDNLPLLVDEVINGTGASNHSTTTASTTISTSATSDYVIRQTKQRFNYQSGKSMLIFMTGSGFNAETNVTKRFGYFSSSTGAPYNTSFDGIFVENDGSDVYLKVYRSGTEINSTIQSSWDDPLDGSGASGVTMDWSKNFIYMMDFEWLGTGAVRHYFIIGSDIHLVHTHKHANVIDDVYMSTPNQPLRWEIRQSGAGSGSFKTICASVNSEGSKNEVGIQRAFSNGVTSVGLASTSNTYPVLAIRLNSAKTDSLIQIKNIDLLETAGKNVYWTLQVNPTLSAPLSYSSLTNSAIQGAVGDGVITVSSDGTIIDGGYLNAKGDKGETLENVLRIGSDIDGTVDELVLCMRPLAVNAVAYSHLHWVEDN